MNFCYADEMKNVRMSIALKDGTQRSIRYDLNQEIVNWVDAGEGGGGRTVKLEPDIDGLHSNLSEVVCLLRGVVSL